MERTDTVNSYPLFLLTGKDANNLQKQEDPAISKAKKKALLTYIQEKLDDLSKRRAELEKAASQCEIVDIPNAIKELKNKFNKLKITLIQPYPKDIPSCLRFMI